MGSKSGIIVCCHRDVGAYPRPEQANNYAEYLELNINVEQHVELKHVELPPALMYTIHNQVMQENCVSLGTINPLCFLTSFNIDSQSPRGTALICAGVLKPAQTRTAPSAAMGP